MNHYETKVLKQFQNEAYTIAMLLSQTRKYLDRAYQNKPHTSHFYQQSLTTLFALKLMLNLLHTVINHLFTNLHL